MMMEIYGNDWKIFYNDKQYVYLIAADYLKTEKIPEEAGMTITDTYSAYWSDESQFAGKQGMQDLPTNVAKQFMLEKYKNDTKYGVATDINSKATALLLDTEVWKDFALGFKGSFAYGSPTVEMWVASWNQKIKSMLYNNVVDEDSHVEKSCNECDFDNRNGQYDDNGYGYRVGTADHNYEEKLDVSGITKGFDDVLYFPHKQTEGGADTYFLATPTYRQENKQIRCYIPQLACVSGDSDITISLEGATKKASQIQSGDSIVYCSSNHNKYEDDSWEGKFKVGTVKDVYKHENANKFVKYVFDDGSTLDVTSYHPIYSQNGWKSFTRRYGYALPLIGDKIRTLNTWKNLSEIQEFSGNETYYDFTVNQTSTAGYLANNTLVESSINTDLTLSGSYQHNYTNYFMDCLVSCSHEGIVGNTQLNIAESNAAIRPIVVLPTNTPGTYSNGLWKLKAADGDLKVSKAVENDNGVDAEKQFQFKVTLSDTSVNGKHGDMQFTNGVTTFTLKNGENKVAQNLPNGITYTVEEVGNNEGYETIVEGNNATGKIVSKAEADVRFKNSKKVGGFKVSKIVDGSQSDKQNDVFTFNVTLNDTSINGTYGEMDFINGVTTFTLKDGESKTAEMLPEGIEYTVSEVIDSSMGYKEQEPQTYVIEKNTEKNIQFTNTKKEIEIVDPKKTSNLEVSKTIDNNNGTDDEKEFHFKVTLSDTSINDTYGEMEFTNGVANILLKNGESKIAEDIPVDTTYKVEEIEDQSYEKLEAKEGVIQENSTAKAEFVNHKKTGGLKVSKKVLENEVDNQKEFTFNVTLSDTSINGTYGDVRFKNGTATFTLKNGQSKEIEGLPEGIEYQVTESDNGDYEIKSSEESGTIRKSENIKVQFINIKDSLAPMRIPYAGHTLLNIILCITFISLIIVLIVLFAWLKHNKDI